MQFQKKAAQITRFPNRIILKKYLIGCNYNLIRLRVNFMAFSYILIVLCALQSALFDVGNKPVSYVVAAKFTEPFSM